MSQTSHQTLQGRCPITASLSVPSVTSPSRNITPPHIRDLKTALCVARWQFIDRALQGSISKN